MKITSNRKRLIDEFVELTSIDAESYHEREIADVLKVKLEDLGFDVTEDETQEATGSNAGNLYGILKGADDMDPVLFSAHMDTVRPGKGKKALVGEDGIIRSDGTTVLGADNVAAIVEIFEAVRMISDAGEKHGDIEILLSTAEEKHCLGSKAFALEKIRSKDVYVPDMSGETGFAANRAPSLLEFNIKVKGRAAHAGFSPENGISAIIVAARAVDRIEQGRLSENMTCNVGRIKGGYATNIVPESCRVVGEIRSLVHEEVYEQLEKIRAVFEEECEKAGAEFSLKHSLELHAYEVDENARVCRDFREACGKLGLKGELQSTRGGSDNNTFTMNGMEGIVLACGMRNVHSTHEHIAIDDLVHGSELIAELIRRR
jgi:tripeptide aminopeptidase